MAADLLPCPFCGASAHVVVIEFADGGPINYGECSNAACCIAFPSADTEDEAIARWNNRRAPPLAAPAPSAMATGDEVRTALRAAGDWIYREILHVEVGMGTSREQRGRDLVDLLHRLAATPPAAPAAVTITDAQVDAALSKIDFTWPESREHMRAALAAAASAERG